MNPIIENIRNTFEKLLIKKGVNKIQFILLAQKNLMKLLKSLNIEASIQDVNKIIAKLCADKEFNEFFMKLSNVIDEKSMTTLAKGFKNDIQFVVDDYSTADDWFDYDSMDRKFEIYKWILTEFQDFYKLDEKTLLDFNPFSEGVTIDESFLINPKKISANGTQISLVTFIDDWLFDNLH